MNIRQLSCFLSVAKNLNYTKAAAELYMSQSTVSYQIKSLEKELGIQLFTRDTHQVSLTPLGEYLLPDAQRLFISMQQISLRIQEYESRNRISLKIGLGMAMDMDTRARLLMDCNRSFPDYDISIIDYNYMDAHESLLYGRVDLLLAFQCNIEEYSHVSFETVLEDRCCYLLREDDPLAKKDELSLEDIMGRHQIFPAGIRMHKDLSRDFFFNFESMLGKNSIFYYAGRENAQALVASGLGIAYVPSRTFYTSDGLVSVPYGKRCVPYAVCWLSGRMTREIPVIKSIMQNLFAQQA